MHQQVEGVPISNASLEANVEVACSIETLAYSQGTGFLGVGCQVESGRLRHNNLTIYLQGGRLTFHHSSCVLYPHFLINRGGILVVKNA